MHPSVHPHAHPSRANVARSCTGFCARDVSTSILLTRMSSPPLLVPTREHPDARTQRARANGEHILGEHPHTHVHAHARGGASSHTCTCTRMRDIVTRMRRAAPHLLLTREHPDSSAPFSLACDRPGSILTRAHVTRISCRASSRS